jgi:pimeloyl-ACP methyl ester carboxylesterase
MGVADLVRFTRVPTNGIELHVAEAGPVDGPIVFLLHGFPEFWYAWRNQIATLTGNGFRVIAPDQRGYNLSDKPPGIASYDLDQLAADVVGLADYFGEQMFNLVGHDWGAALAWWVAGQYGSRVRRLAVMNAPHPAVWADAMEHNPAQKQKSSYVRFFRLPWLPELVLKRGNYAALAKGFRDSIRKDAFTQDDLKLYRDAWSQPGAITAMLNWYRAFLRKPMPPPDQYRIRCPTLVIWGMRDVYGVPELADASVRLCEDGRLIPFAHATHWVQHDEPEKVGKLLVDFLLS